MGQNLKAFNYGDSTFLVGRKGFAASYPRYMDSVISFDERLGEIKNESTRSILKTLMSHIESEYIPGVQDKRDIGLVEDDMVNYSQMFLYGLADLYKISTTFQRRDIIESLITSQIQQIDFL